MYVYMLLLGISVALKRVAEGFVVKIMAINQVWH